MRQHGLKLGRSATEWTIRISLVFLAMGIGFVSVTYSLAEVVKLDNPSYAHEIAPGNARISALLAQKLFAASPEADPQSSPAGLARLAISQDPTAVQAVATLGLQAQLAGNAPIARRFFDYAQLLSRRDIYTQLWAIEDAVRRGDVPGALRHYDIALRTEPQMADVLFPILAVSSVQPVIQVALVDTLVRNSPWAADFVNYLASQNPHPRENAVLLLKLRRAGLAVPESARSGAIYALILKDHADEAWSYYSATQPGVDRRRSRDPRFRLATPPTPLDWVAINEGGISSSLQAPGVDFAASTSAGGPLLRQYELLPPGEYRLTGRTAALDAEEGAHPYWILMCQSGRELGRVELNNSTQDASTFVGTFSVPADCPIQMLMLIARPSNRISGLSGRIDYVQLNSIR